MGLTPCAALYSIRSPDAQPVPAALSCSLSFWRAAAANSLAARCFRKSLPMTPSQSWLPSSCNKWIDFSNVKKSLQDVIRIWLARIRKLAARQQQVFFGPLDGATIQASPCPHIMTHCAQVWHTLSDAD